MKSLKDIREEIIKGFIARNLISQSIYPTLEIVCSILIRDYGMVEIGKTLIRDYHKVEDGERGSASKMNDIINSIDLDLDTLYAFIDYVDEYFEKSRNSSIQKLKALQRTVKKLSSKASILHLINNNSDRSVQIIDQPITDSSIIDNNATDAKIDYGYGYISAKSEIAEYLQSLSETIDTATATSGTTGHIFFKSPPGFGIDKLYNNDDTPWIQQVIMPPSYTGEVQVTLRLELNESIEINRIFMGFDDLSTYKISLTASVNGSHIAICDFEEHQGFADISFSPITTSYIIVNIKTASHVAMVTEPKKGKMYKFSCKEFYIGKVEYAEKSIYQTTSITGLNPYSVVGIFTEQETPSGTSLLYEVSWDSGDWHQIEPYNNTKIDFTKYVSVFTNLTQTNQECSIDFTVMHPYIAGSIIGTSATFSSLENIDLLYPRILRNLGNLNLESLSDDIISCVIYVDSSTLTFDFSNYPCYLDNVFYDHQKVLGSGFHTIVFNSKHQSGYKTYLDSLVTGGSLYYGTHLAEYKQQMVLGSQNYNVFSLVYVDSEYVVILKKLDDQGWDDESFLLVQNDISQDDIDNLPDNIKLRATLNATEYSTPIIKNIKIKLGQ